jgi:cysteine-rich repeat protein
LVVLSALSLSDASAAKLHECRATCAASVEDECADLSRKKARRCRKRIVRECRRTGLERCLPPTTTTLAATTTSTTSVTTTSEPTPSSSTTTTSTTTIPTPYCQNGIRDGLEQCDGDDIGDATCPEGSTGTPVCKLNCKLDYGPCNECGDGNLDAGEFCDDGNHDAHDGCSPTCQDECGDGILEPAGLEACDDGNESSGDGCNMFCELTPIYNGGGDDPSDVCALQWGASTDTPVTGTVTCADGQSPCDHGPAGDETCRFLVFFCMNNPSFNTPCTWSGVSGVELVGDSLSGAAALDDAEQSSVLGAFVTAFEFAGGVASGTNPGRTVTPVVTRGELCGQFALDVASGSRRTVAVRIEDDNVPADVDVDQLALTCATSN